MNGSLQLRHGWLVVIGFLLWATGAHAASNGAPAPSDESSDPGAASALVGDDFDDDDEHDDDDDDDDDDEDSGEIVGDEQFAPVHRRGAPLDQPDSDGRRGLEVKGEFGRGLKFSTPGSTMSLQLRVRAQVQASAEGIDGIDQVAFQVRRARLVFGGHALNKLLTFYIQLSLAEGDLELDHPVPVRDAYATLHFTPWLNLSAGQMKVPFDRQRVLSDSRQQLVERARVVNELNLDRDIGLQVHGDIPVIDVKYHLGVFSGDGRNHLNEDLGLLYMGRVRWAVLGGSTGQFETDLERLPRLRLSLAGAAGYNNRSHRERSTQGPFLAEGSADRLHVTADVALKYAGWSFLSSFIMRETLRFRGGAGELARTGDTSPNQRGVFVQSGYLLPIPIEIAARVGWLQSYGRYSKNDEELELTGGLNWIIIGHDLKLQASYTAVLTHTSTEHAIRLQTQIFF